MHAPVACLAFALLWSGTAAADQTDPRLTPLFEALKAAPDPASAHAIEAQIWPIWMQTDVAAARAALDEGVDQMNQGNFQQAREAFDRVVRAAPDFAEGWNKRATALYLLGKFTESVADIDRVLALEPRHFGALSGLGMCDARLNQDREALRALQRARDIDPQMPGIDANIETLRQRIAKESI